MKRILTYISVLAVVAFSAASCVDQVFPKGSGPTPVVAASGIDITIEGRITDDAVTFTVAPKEEGLYYSFVVRKGKPQDEKEKIDSMQLYQGKVSGIEGDVVKFTKASKTTVKLTELDPFTFYTIYAVNSSKEGNVSSVVSKTFQTTDTVAPKVEDFDNDENAVEIEFSEDVTYVEGKAITATVYYKNYLTGSPWKSSVDAANVAVKGNVVTFTLPEVTIPGSYFAIKYPQGTFIDAAGLECEAVNSKFLSAVVEDPETGEESFTFEGIVGFLENDDLVYELPELSKVASWTSPYNVHVPNGVSRVDLASGYYTVISHLDASGTISQTAVPMAKLTNYYGTYYDVVLKIAGKDIAQAGDQIGIIIPAGAVMDWFGNVNEDDIEVTCLPCPYQMKDFYGRYTVNGTSAYKGTKFADTFDIEPFDGGDYNLKISGTLGGKAVTMYAIASPEEGYFEVPFQYIGKLGNYDMYICLANQSSYYMSYSLGWDMIASHTFVDWYSAIGMNWGLMAVSGKSILGFVDQINISSIQYVGPVPTTESVQPSATREFTILGNKAVLGKTLPVAPKHR